MPRHPMVAMIALRDDKMPSPNAFFEKLPTTWPKHPLPEEVVRAHHEEQEILTFSLERSTVAMSRMPAPIPWSDLEGPCRYAWYYWPEAAESFQEHESHLLIVQTPAPDDADTPLTELAMRLTRITAAAIEASDAVGVVWGGSGRVHEPSTFVRACREVPEGLLPIELWIGFSLIQENDGTHSIYTDGMETFGLMEVEVHRTFRDPQHLYARVFDVVHFMLQRNIMFQEGETFGMSDDERVVVQHGPSRAEPESRAIILDL